MAERPLCILQVNTTDVMGGAEKVAFNLLHEYRRRGYDAWLAVGHKLGDDPHISEIRHADPGGDWRRFWSNVQARLQSRAVRVPVAGRLARLARAVGRPRRILDGPRGLEDFGFPETWFLLRLAPRPPDILHCHNLHGSYFDLRALPWLAQEVPVFLTLHDAWLLSGHCAHSCNCDRWTTGCGDCPDLSTYPSIRRDATAYNWRRKRAIYAQSHLYVATPSRWLMGKVERSILKVAVAEARVIPNGVDLTSFHPADRSKARAALGIPQDARMLLFAANGIRKNPWKDYRTLRSAIALVAEHLSHQHVIFVALGDDAPPETIGRAEVRFVPFQKDPSTVARYYQATDLYTHAALADTFPNTVLEALACGSPIVATAVGGVVEQVKGLRIPDTPSAHPGLNKCPMDQATGLLAAAGDANSMAAGIERLLENESVRAQLGANAARDARDRFDLQRQADRYLAWYQDIIDEWCTQRSLRQTIAV
jgi:glycosyltransferase involved in cell wall biosynthesis